MNLTDKKRYFKPRLIVVPIDQEITMVMMSEAPTLPGLPPPPSPASSLPASEIFGSSTPNVGTETINWGKK